MPKYWMTNYFAHGRFPEVGQKTEKERKNERKLVITMAKLRMAHASTHSARKPPGPISCAKRHSSPQVRPSRILQGLRVAQAAVTERWP